MLHTDLVRLHLTPFPRLLHQMLMHLLAACAELRSMLPSTLVPIIHGALIQTEGSNNGSHRATMRQKRDDLCHELDRVAKPVKHRAFGGTECLTANVADVTALLPAMNADVALTYLTSCRTRFVVAEYIFGIHSLTPLYGNTLGCQQIPFVVNPYSTV